MGVVNSGNGSGIKYMFSKCSYDQCSTLKTQDGHPPSTSTIFFSAGSYGHFKCCFRLKKKKKKKPYFHFSLLSNLFIEKGLPSLCMPFVAQRIICKVSFSE
ncbi:hypothetical protein Syun_029993 [Stephania yunnanensis]|uniref:Uncharacterized protein n=1 Tax=Stephania yunnanensis TaxID=152371 RepID=A0AAP0HHT0_9MAGN